MSLLRVCIYRLTHDVDRILSPPFTICEEVGRTGAICDDCWREMKRMRDENKNLRLAEIWQGRKDGASRP